MDETDRTERLEKYAFQSLREDIDYIEGYSRSAQVQEFASHAREILNALDLDGESPMEEEERVAQLEKFAGENLAAVLAELSARGDTVRSFGKDFAKLAKKVKKGKDSQAEEIAQKAMLLRGLGKHIDKRASAAAEIIELLGIHTDGPRYYLSNMTDDEVDGADEGDSD